MYYNGIRVQVLQQWKVSASNTTWGLGNKKLMVILDWKLNREEWGCPLYGGPKWGSQVADKKYRQLKYV